MDEWTSLFPVELPGVTIASWHAPVEDDRLGFVVRVQVYDPTSYRGPIADLCLVGPDERERLPAAVDAVRVRLEGLRATPDAERWLSAPVAETLGLEAIVVDDHTFDANQLDAARREAALASVDARFESVRARIAAQWGLRLPRHLGVYAALLQSLSPLERSGLEDLGRWPAGIMVYFEEGGLDRATRDGLDPRLEMRYRRDPAEFLTVMSGDSDGLHYGLWYDDPAELPSFIAANWARDSAETGERGPTTVQVLHEELNDRIEDPSYPEEPTPVSLHALRAAVAWFGEADAAAWAAEPPRWAGVERGAILGGVGPAVPDGAGDPEVGWRASQTRHTVYGSSAEGVATIIAKARAELAAGRPALAWTVGHELHWMDDDATRGDALSLLTGAYRALGRDALAEIAEVHHAHRDLRSVGVFLRADE